MKHILLAAAIAALVPAGASAADAPDQSHSVSLPVLGLQHKTLVRCSAAFAIIAHEQGQGVQSALAFLICASAVRNISCAPARS